MLSVFVAVSIVQWLVHPTGATNTTLGVLRVCALMVWAADEVIRGVNPFRRVLGSVVLLAEIANLAS